VVRENRRERFDLLYHAFQVGFWGTAIIGGCRLSKRRLVAETFLVCWRRWMTCRESAAVAYSVCAAKNHR
jgi:hypothetical protein